MEDITRLREDMDFKFEFVFDTRIQPRLRRFDVLMMLILRQCVARLMRERFICYALSPTCAYPL